MTIRERKMTYPMNPVIQRTTSTIDGTEISMFTTWPSAKERHGIYSKIDSPFTPGKFTPGDFRVNPVEILQYSISCKEGRYSYIDVRSRWRYAWYGHVMGPGLPAISLEFPDFPSALGQISHTKALAKLNDTKFDVLAFIGEIRETILMMRQPLAAFQRYWESPQLRDLVRRIATKRYVSPRDYRRQKRAKDMLALERVTGPLDVASGIWLQIRYGLMPLIYDLEGIIDMINEKFDHNSSVLRAKRAGKRSFERQTTYMGTWYNNLYLPYKVEKTITYKATTCVYYYLAEMSQRLRTIRNLGTTVEHLPAVAWEITRLSFVVDWFLNVGDFLQSIEPNHSVSVLGGCTSKKTEVEYRITPHGVPTIYGYTIPVMTLATPEIVLIGRRLKRDTPITLPASPVFNISTLSVKRAIDMLSLLWSYGNGAMQKQLRKTLK